MSECVVTTSAGRVQGAVKGAVRVFKGVPYAAAPVGARRFGLPEAAQSWDGVRPAIEPGPTAPWLMRPFDELDIRPLVGEGWRKGDEYLNANIWAPDTDSSGLPVMVFIHGGAFVAGCNEAPVISGEGFARSGVVCVTINYRLGVDGFMVIDGVPTNLGLRDQIFALQWVRENARAFGGDPDNITVFGESAGAMSIASLVGSPFARGLFRRAIIQSGHGEMVRTIPVARRLTRRMAKLLKVRPDAGGFAKPSAEKALLALEKVQMPLPGIDLREADGREPAYGLSRFLPVTGDDLLPEPTNEALRKGAGSDIDILIGANREEMNLYFVPTGVKKKINGLLARIFLGKSMKGAGRMLRAYGLGRRGVKAGQALADAMHDLVFRLPVRRFAAAHRGRTWVYEFDWRSSAFNGELGACHAMDVPFVFDTIDVCSGPKGFVGENPPQGLADRVHGLWVAFARGEDLPWSQYDDATRQVFSLEKGLAERDVEMPAERLGA